MDFDHYVIAKVEPGRLWLEIPEGDENSIESLMLLVRVYWLARRILGCQTI